MAKHKVTFLPADVTAHVLPTGGGSARDDSLLAHRDFSGVQARIDAARRRMARTNGSGRARELAGFGAKLRQAWDSESFDWRRAIVTTSASG